MAEICGLHGTVESIPERAQHSSESGVGQFVNAT